MQTVYHVVKSHFKSEGIFFFFLQETAQPSILKHQHVNAIFYMQNFQKS